MVTVKLMNKPVRKDPDLMRLNRYIASSGICSRRDADELIRKGAVEINGKKVTELGTQVSAKDQVKVNGKLIRNERKVYILMNKPKDTLTTTDDPEGRQTVLDIIGDISGIRVFPVGRLDRNTTGVLLLTNDGELAAKLTHPRYGVKKVYEVRTAVNVTDNHIEQLLNGIELDDGPMKADNIAFSDPSSRQYLQIEIHSGKNRVIRRMFEQLGIEIIKLDRISFAGLTKKNLARGRWRFLSPKEVGWLKMMRGTGNREYRES